MKKTNLINKTNHKKLIDILKYTKLHFQKIHDDFHLSTMKFLNVNFKKDDFRTFLEKVIFMDIQSRPNNLTKYQLIEIMKELKKKKIYKSKIIYNTPSELITTLYKELISIKNIGHKIAYLITKNLIYFGNCKKYFNYHKKELLPLLNIPIDVHIKNLFCYRLKIVTPENYKYLKPDNHAFQKEIKNILTNEENLYPVDFDIFWIIGAHYCNKRIYCNYCKMKKYCRDFFFQTESLNQKSNIENNKNLTLAEKEKRVLKINNQINMVKKNKEFKFYKDGAPSDNLV